jgi:uncharacterized protein with ParB-like and HNH nuclease domain
MKKNNLPLTNASIKEIYYEGQTQNIYQVPIYQRNYAWEDTEINALVKDVFDSYEKSKKAPEKDSVYYIGTLVTYKRNDNNFEVIDGQQRLTTIYLILKALEENPKNKLTYSARKKSKDTIEQLPKLPEVYDEGIKNGFGFVQNAIKEIVGDKKDEFKKYFLNNVRIIHYQVPKDVDLNHYFEVMNSRGEQLEKHEIIKARLSEHLRGNDLKIFSEIWESCSDMNRYIQQKYKIFGEYFSSFNDDINIFEEDSCEKLNNKPTIKSLLDSKVSNIKNSQIKENSDSFQSIIDFPNFLLIVLKLTRILKEDNFIPEAFSLDDKELINEFDKFGTSTEDAKLFINNLIKAKYFLDNYIVHHVDSEKENVGDNPWELEYYHVDGNNRHPKNLSDNKAIQDELVHLLSLLEVTFTAKQRKNYLLYCLLYLFQNGHTDIESYCNFVRNLVHKMFYDIYLNSSNLNEINNLPKPNAFDSEILNGKKIELTIQNKNPNFSSIYKEGSMNIPLFVFNFTDYKIWVKYANEIRGNQTKKDAKKRISFFEDLGCSDFDLEPFNSFYFSRTRKSLEHYYPQAKAGENGIVSEKDINRFGNFAMISANANSSGSDWDPKTKLEHYTDKKSDPVGVASLKFKIMMQICSDNSFSREKGLEWILEDMNQHQEKMMKIILEN